MEFSLERLHIKNYRCLADVTLSTGPVNVFFGPNGGGKSTILDTLRFFRDVSILGLEAAVSARSHGIGMRYDGAGVDDPVTIELGTPGLDYELSLGFSPGRSESFPGELLPDATKLTFTTVPGREQEAIPKFDAWLGDIRLYDARNLDIRHIRTEGSLSDGDTHLAADGKNLWSVLRNLSDRRKSDDRYEIIVGFERAAFPSFDEIGFEQTGQSSVYASFLDRERAKPIEASGVSDGYLQMLLCLTALFCQPRDRASAVLLDEPEISLHPWAIAKLGDAVRHAAAEWNKQVFIATHSPVLISQFEDNQILAVELEQGRTQVTPVSQAEGIQDLLAQYAAGSLYMSEMIAPQSAPAGGAPTL